MGDFLDKLIKSAATVDYRHRNRVLDATEQFSSFYKVVNRHRLFAEIKPQSKQSTNFGLGRAYTSKKKRLYMKKLLDGLMATYGLRKKPIMGPVVLTVLYSFQYSTICKEWGWSFNVKRPDVDNLLKPLKDVMSGVCYRDDSQVVGVNAWKICSSSIFIAVLLDEIEITTKNFFV